MTRKGLVIKSIVLSAVLVCCMSAVGISAEQMDKTSEGTKVIRTVWDSEEVYNITNPVHFGYVKPAFLKYGIEVTGFDERTTEAVDGNNGAELPTILIQGESIDNESGSVVGNEQELEGSEPE